MSDSKLKSTVVRKQKAASGKVDFAQPVTIHQSSRTRVTVLPFYVDRSTGEHDVSLKIQTYAKRPPLDWIETEDKSITLSAEATRKLFVAMRDFLQVADADNGNCIVLRVSDGTADVSTIAPDLLASALTDILQKKDIVRHLVHQDLGSELVNALRGAIRLKQLRSALELLRADLDNEVIKESRYQSWCQEHGWAFGNAYVLTDKVHAISAGDKLDLMVQSVASGLRDLIELKRPDMHVLRWDKDHKSYYWSPEASKAIGQCHRYLDVLHDVAQKGLQDHPQIVAYHPRATIVIGRSQEWKDKKLRALHGLNRRLNGITVLTYDQLLAQGERLLEVLDQEVQQDSRADGDGFDWNDDMF